MRARGGPSRRARKPDLEEEEQELDSQMVTLSITDRMPDIIGNADPEAAIKPPLRASDNVLKDKCASRSTYITSTVLTNIPCNKHMRQKKPHNERPTSTEDGQPRHLTGGARSYTHVDRDTIRCVRCDSPGDKLSQGGETVEENKKKVKNKGE
jgi:hypothetical protein